MAGDLMSRGNAKPFQKAARTNRTTVFVNSTVVSDLKIRSVCNIHRQFVLSLVSFIADNSLQICILTRLVNILYLIVFSVADYRQRDNMHH